jgi:general L-amino acid transport system permease protein
VRAAPRPPWRNIRILRIVAQVVALVVAVGVIAYVFDNIATNLRIRNIPTGFDFLDRPATIQIAYSDFRASQPVRDAILVGVKNTLVVASVGIVLTLVLGTIIGIARLSPNLLVRTAAGLYVETLRNVPPLLVIVFANAAIFLQLPVITDPFELGGFLLLTNREIGVASPVLGDGFGAYLALLAGAVVLAGAVWVVRTRRFEATGQPHHRLAIAGGIVAFVAIVGYLALEGPFALSHPEVENRNIVGGLTTSIGYGAVVTGLVLYTSSHVAEIVRGSVQSVPVGQTEAAAALGLSSSKRLRHVVLPQAFRIAVPPMINQFLNLTKNSSLAIAVGYAELSALTLVLISQANPAPQMVLILMTIYLVISIVISIIANVVNRRLQLVER